MPHWVGIQIKLRADNSRGGRHTLVVAINVEDKTEVVLADCEDEQLANAFAKGWMKGAVMNGAIEGDEARPVRAVLNRDTKPS